MNVKHFTLIPVLKHNKTKILKGFNFNTIALSSAIMKW